MEIPESKKDYSTFSILLAKRILSFFFSSLQPFALLFNWSIINITGKA